MNQSKILAELLVRELSRLIEEIQKYNDQQYLWKVQTDINNSAGNLCLHLVGNLNHSTGAVLGQTDFVRDRPAEFNTKFILRHELIPLIKATKQMTQNVLGRS